MRVVLFLALSLGGFFLTDKVYRAWRDRNRKLPQIAKAWMSLLLFACLFQALFVLLRLIYYDYNFTNLEESFYPAIKNIVLNKEFVVGYFTFLAVIIHWLCNNGTKYNYIIEITIVAFYVTYKQEPFLALLLDGLIIMHKLHGLWRSKAGKFSPITKTWVCVASYVLFVPVASSLQSMMGLKGHIFDIYTLIWHKYFLIEYIAYNAFFVIGFVIMIIALVIWLIGEGTIKGAISFGLCLVALVLCMFVPTRAIAYYESSLESATQRFQSVTSVSASDGSTMAIETDGSLWAWGSYRYFLVGSRSFPVKIMDSVTAVSLGSSHFMVIKSDGSLWSWGSNSSGKLGDGTTVDRISPVKIMDSVVMVSAGTYNSYAIKSDNSLWAWGDNSCGQLGDGTKNASYSPIKIMDSVVSVSAGSRMYAMAIKEDDSLWGWGDNSYGALGDGTTEDKSIPVKIMDSVSMVSAGYQTIAIKTDGSLLEWGENSIFEGRYSPVKLMDSAVVASAGNGHSQAIKADGTLWAWGSPYMIFPPDKRENYAIPFIIMDSVAAVSAGEKYTMAIKSDGSLWAWGERILGQLGDGLIHDIPPNFRKEPVRITNSAAQSEVIKPAMDRGLLAQWLRQLGSDIHLPVISPPQALICHPPYKVKSRQQGHILVQAESMCYNNHTQ